MKPRLEARVLSEKSLWTGKRVYAIRVNVIEGPGLFDFSTVDFQRFDTRRQANAYLRRQWPEVPR